MENLVFIGRIDGFFVLFTNLFLLQFKRAAKLKYSATNLPPPKIYSQPGLYRQACNTLLPILDLAEFDCSNLIDNQISPTEKAIIENLPNSEIAASGLKILGDVLRLTGALNNSQIMLNRSLAAAQNLQLDADVSAAYLSFCSLD